VIRKLAVAVACTLAFAPAGAAAERIVTKSGEVIVGEPRFEGAHLVVRRRDGSEVRIPRSQVERIELENGKQAPPAGSAPRPAPPAPRDGPPPPRTAPPAPRQGGVPRTTPREPRYVPPKPQRPDPSVGRRMLENTGFRNGLALKLGYQRGMAAGLEWQQRLGRFVGLGIGGQVGLAANADVACPTVGGTGRLYAGNEHRFVGELGFGLNRIDPYIGLDGIREPTCGDAERNWAPEFSAGYQFASRGGLLFEVLGGLTFLTNDELARRHADVAGLFTANIGFVFR